MMDLIDRQAALEKMCGDCKSEYDGHCPHPFGMCHEYESILEVPTISPEVRHGRWIPHDVIENMKCSECGEEFRMPFDFNANVYPYNFCPNCGADMRGDADGDQV